MKSCKEYQSLIDLYLEDGLTKAEKQHFLSHISSCKECREALRFAESVKAALAGLPQIDLPGDFTQRVHEKVLSERKAKKGIGTYFVRYGSVAACLVLAIAVAQSIDKTDFTKNSENALPNHIIQEVMPEAATDKQNVAEENPTPTEEKKAHKVQPPAKVTETAEPKQTAPKAKIAEPEAKTVPSEKEDTPLAANEAVTVPPADAETRDENNDITTFSLDVSAVSEDDTDENVTFNYASSGGSSRHTNSAYVTLSVAAEQFETAAAIISEFAQSTDGVYTADSESFNLVLQKLTEQSITFNKHGEASEETISFVLKTI